MTGLLTRLTLGVAIRVEFVSRYALNISRRPRMRSVSGRIPSSRVWFASSPRCDVWMQVTMTPSARTPDQNVSHTMPQPAHLEYGVP